MLEQTRLLLLLRKRSSATVEKTIEKKYASSTVKDTYRNDWRTKEYLERNHS